MIAAVTLLLCQPDTLQHDRWQEADRAQGATIFPTSVDLSHPPGIDPKATIFLDSLLQSG
jgi:hypothetical protein